METIKENLTIAELIEELKKYNPEMKVRIQYRDEGGDYTGTDKYIYFEVEEDKLIL